MVKKMIGVMYNRLVSNEFNQINGLAPGLKLSSNGTLLVDSSHNWLWSGRHVFTESVQFSGSQRYSIEQLVDNKASLGSVYWHNGISIQKVAPNSPHKVLFFDGSRVSWSTPTLDYVVGTLRVENGGTGLSKISRGEILFSSGNNAINGLPIGREGEALVIQNGLPSWKSIGNICGSVLNGFVPVSSSNNFLSSSPIFVSNDSVEINTALKIEQGLIISSNLNCAFIGIGKTQIIIDNESGFYKIGVAEFNSKGVMTAGGVQSELIKGLISTSQGGTGISKYVAGDLIYADASGDLVRLAAPSGEGWVLGLGPSGFPSWLDVSAIKIEGGHRRVKLETDGNSLFFINKKKERILLNGESSNKQVLISPVHLGGTGEDLSALTCRGSIMVGKNRDAWTALHPGPKGHILSSRGSESMPEWVEPPLVLKPGDGLKLLNDTVSIDEKASINWTSKQTFKSTYSKLAKIEHLKFDCVPNLNSPTIGSVWSDGDDVYVQTRRGQKALVNPDSKSDVNRIVVLPLAQSINLADNAIVSSKLEACAAVVPFSISNPSSTTRWKLKRIDAVPFALSSLIRLQVNRNGQNIFEDYLNVYNSHVGCVNFIESIFTSGDIISLNSDIINVSGFLNVTALLEEYHG